MPLPLALTVPAAVAGMAYLDAKHFISADVAMIRRVLTSILYMRKCERRDENNIFYLIEAQARNPKLANSPYVIYEGQTWTYAQTYEMALKYGTWLKEKHGVMSGEMVAMDFQNSASFMFMWFGLWSIGAKVAFINYNLTGAPLIHCVKVSTARLLFVDESVKAVITKEVEDGLRSSSVKPVEIVYFTKAHEEVIEAVEGVRMPDSTRKGQTGLDNCQLIYTSGTTGLPKPVNITWARIHRAIAFTGPLLNLTSRDRFYTCMPLYHSSASMLGALSSLYCGSAFVIGRNFSSKTFWPTVRESEATVIQYVGETCRYLLAAPSSPLDTKHKVRLAYGNGLRPDIWEKFKARFGIETVMEFYAATEAPGGSWNKSRNTFTTGAIGHSGTLIRSIFAGRTKIVEMDFVTELPRRDPKTGFCIVAARGEPGELIQNLPVDDIESTFSGYYKNSGATNSKIIRDVFRKGDAFFRSGDIVRLDQENRLYFSDRIGDTFRWKSENVSTAEVSEVLGRHPSIAEANVYGVELPGHDGRAGCAAVVLNNEALPDAAVLQSLATHANANLAKFALPVFLRFTGTMQATGTNKQQKTGLRGEGVDPAKLGKSKDRMFWLQGKTYVPFKESDWAALQGGKLRL